MIDYKNQGRMAKASAARNQSNIFRSVFDMVETVFTGITKHFRSGSYLVKV